MAPLPITPYPLAFNKIQSGGAAVAVAFGPLAGGFIVNPRTAADQGIAVVEAIFVDVTGNPAVTRETATCVPVQPGGVFVIPAGLTTDVSVNALTSGHSFGGVVYQPSTPFPPVPQPGTFPPTGPTTLTQTLPSYLYKEYDDDESLQAFVAAYNVLAQVYVTWFATVCLANYTNAAITGPLLDWIAEGLYGMFRPALSSGQNRDVGPLNTYPYNTLAMNVRKFVGPNNVTIASDDVFKRVMTWNFYKGDGNVFSVEWLKRRIMRFLIGENGTAPNVDQTYAISVTWGNGIIVIRITAGTRTITGGALYNRFGFNRMTYNGLKTVFAPSPQPQFALEPVFQEAMDSGVLIMPIKFKVSVLI